MKLRQILLINVLFIMIILVLSGCMKMPLPAKPTILFSPSNPFAGQTVEVKVLSTDDYSNLYYSASIDGKELNGDSNTGVFQWIATEGTHTVVASVSDTYTNTVSATTILKVELPPPPSIKKIRWYPSNPIGGEMVDFEVEATSVIGIEDVEIKIDSSDLKISKASDTYNANWTAVPGIHDVEVLAKDTQGSVYSTQTTISVKPYPFPKIRSFTWTPQNPTFNDKHVVFKVVGEDPNGFYANISVDGKDIPTTAISTSTMIATWDVSAGYHEVNVRLEDSKGWNVQQTRYLSILPPQSDLNVQIGISPKSPQHGDKVTVKAFASDSYAPIDTMILFVDGMEEAQVATNILSFTFVPSDGSHEITVKAIDKLNEKSSSNLFFNVQFDPEMYPPKLETRFTPYATVGTPKLLSIYATATAPESLIKKITFINMVSSKTIGESTLGNNGIFSIAWTPQEAGYIPILITALDSYNTQSATVIMMKVYPRKVNGDSPTIRPSFESLIKQSSRVTLCASVTSKYEIKNVNMWVDDVPLTPSVNSSGLYCVEWIAQATGTHTFKVLAEDVYGHETSETFYFYVYPSNLPIVKLILSSTTFYVGDTLSASATVKSSAPVDHVNFYVDGTLKDTSYVSPYILNLKVKKVGIHTITVEAVDIYGNKGYTQANFTVKEDKVPPFLSVSVPSTASSGESVTIKIVTFDKQSGVKRLKVDIYSSVFPQPYPNIVPIYSKTYSYPSTQTILPFIVATGTYKIDVFSEDAVGNRSFLEKKIFTAY